MAGVGVLLSSVISGQQSQTLGPKKRKRTMGYTQIPPWTESPCSCDVEEEALSHPKSLLPSTPKL